MEAKQRFMLRRFLDALQYVNNVYDTHVNSQLTQLCAKKICQQTSTNQQLQYIIIPSGHVLIIILILILK